MNLITWPLILSVLLPLCAMASSGSPPAPVKNKLLRRSEVIDNFIKEGWDFEIPRTIDGLTSEFGKPRSPITRRPSVTDKTITVVNAMTEDIDITLYEFSNGKTAVSHLRIRSSNYKMKMGLYIGVDKKDVIAKLGPPNHEEDNTLSYVSSDVPARVFIRLKDNKVNSYSFMPMGNKREKLFNSLEALD